MARLAIIFLLSFLITYQSYARDRGTITLVEDRIIGFCVNSEDDYFFVDALTKLNSIRGSKSGYVLIVLNGKDSIIPGQEAAKIKLLLDSSVFESNVQFEFYVETPGPPRAFVLQDKARLTIRTYIASPPKLKLSPLESYVCTSPLLSVTPQFHRPLDSVLWQWKIKYEGDKAFSDVNTGTPIAKEGTLLLYAEGTDYCRNKATVRTDTVTTRYSDAVKGGNLYFQEGTGKTCSGDKIIAIMTDYEAQIVEWKLLDSRKQVKEQGKEGNSYTYTTQNSSNEIDTLWVQAVVRASNASCGADSQLIRLIVSPLPSLGTKLPKDTTLEPNSSITYRLQQVKADSFTWTIGGRDTTTVDSFLKLTVPDHTFALQLRGHLNSCQTVAPTAYITVPMDYYAAMSSLEGGIATLFTPGNGDNANDTWIVYDNIEPQQVKVSVFSVTGERVFYSNDYKNDWEGKYKGENLPGGRYYYEVQFTKPYSYVFSGTLTILR